MVPATFLPAGYEFQFLHTPNSWYGQVFKCHYVNKCIIIQHGFGLHFSIFSCAYWPSINSFWALGYMSDLECLVHLVFTTPQGQYHCIIISLHIIYGGDPGQMTCYVSIIFLLSLFLSAPVRHQLSHWILTFFIRCFIPIQYLYLVVYYVYKWNKSCQAILCPMYSIVFYSIFLLNEITATIN